MENGVVAAVAEVLVLMLVLAAVLVRAFPSGKVVPH
jgi:hypothetical protein